MNNVVKLEPFYKKAVWGSESWLVSSHANGKSTIGKNDLDIDIPYLVKSISTHQNLSIQVHPSGINSKNESWLITRNEEGAGIYFGFKEDISKIQFEEAINNQEDISKFLNFIPVKKGDFFLIPTGTIHAIGSGIELIEIQETSDTTYRVWDWNRKGLDGNSRELHIKEALECIQFNVLKPESFNTENIMFMKEEIASFKGIYIELLSLPAKQEVFFKLEPKSSLVLLNGNVSIFSNNEEQLLTTKAFLSLKESSITLKGESDSKVLKIRYQNE